MLLLFLIKKKMLLHLQKYSYKQSIQQEPKSETNIQKCLETYFSLCVKVPSYFGCLKCIYASTLSNEEEGVTTSENKLLRRQLLRDKWARQSTKVERSFVIQSFVVCSPRSSKRKQVTPRSCNHAGGRQYVRQLTIIVGGFILWCQITFQFTPLMQKG